MNSSKRRALFPSIIISAAFLFLAGCSTNNQPASSDPSNNQNTTGQGTTNQTTPSNQSTNNQGTSNQTPQSQQQSPSATGIVGDWKTANRQVEAEFSTNGAVEIENGTAKYRGTYSLAGNSQITFSNLMLDAEDSRGGSASSTLPNSTSSYQLRGNNLTIDNLPSVGRCELTWVKAAD